jgi:hypothetical protein
VPPTHRRMGLRCLPLLSAHLAPPSLQVNPY